MKLENLKELYLDELRDVYDAEHQILDALPKMEKAATSKKLKSAFRDHLKETKGQVERLERVFERLGEKPKRKTCKAMKGLISEGEQMVAARGDDETRDAGLIASAQRVEHYEIAAYGTLRTYARTLGETEQARLLEETLDEESATDTKLTELAESGINAHAAMAMA